jgi:uncharacterized protein
LNGRPEPLSDTTGLPKPSTTIGLPQVARAAELCALIGSSAWMLGVLASVRAAGLPDAWVGAGIIRDLVWDSKFGGGFDPSRINDVDVAFFDPTDLRPSRDDAAESRLRELRPDVRWDAKNQAAVHVWYPDHFGITVEPFRSIEEAIASWPETATSVAVRRTETGVLEVVAPLGLDDLLDGAWRRNPTRVTVEESARRLGRKQPEARWPGVRVYPPEDSISTRINSEPPRSIY